MLSIHTTVADANSFKFLLLLLSLSQSIQVITKMKLIAGAIMFALAVSNVASASDAVYSDAAKAISLVKNAERRAALLDFSQKCFSKKWFACHMARLRLGDVGLRLRGIDGASGVRESFGDAKSDAAFSAVVSASAKTDYIKSHLIVTTASKGGDVFGGDAVYSDESMIGPFADIMQKVVLSRSVPYNVDENNLDSRTGEWARLLAIYFSVVQDSTDAYEALDYERKQINSSAYNAAVYNATRDAVLKMLQRGTAK